MTSKASKPPIGVSVLVKGTFDAVVERATAALKAEGFGVLCDLEVHKILKEKIGVDRAPYRILGACNPPLAHQALGAVPDVGLLLPCNVTVAQEGDKVRVSAIRPSVMLSVLPSHPTLDAVAKDVEERMARVIKALG